MKKEFKDRLDLLDGLDHVRAKIDFMNIACCEMFGPSDWGHPGEHIIHGMSLLFDSINDQISDITNAIHENVYEVTEQRIEKIPKTDINKKTDTFHALPGVVKKMRAATA
ncbi:MAG: hypothetical protein PHN75_14530 [Syntrophales bacterium]|nr:hypothetical protein [Syntrophales bacterium]